MPRRRMTSARKRQIEQWQEAGAQARRRSAQRAITTPMGKHVIAFHHTTKDAAKMINANGFGKQDHEKYVWFSNRRKGQAQAYQSRDNSGGVVFRMRVPRKSIRVANYMGDKETWLGVDPAYLRARYRRGKANQSRKAKGQKPITTPIKAGLGGSLIQIYGGLGGKRVRK